MNAYIASFMLLLFNAVGLAVPASAATEERMVPELGSAADLSETAIAGQCSTIATTDAVTSDRQSCVSAEGWASAPIAVIDTDRIQPARTEFALRADSGDKLEHEEGAP